LAILVFVEMKMLVNLAQISEPILEKISNWNSKIVLIIDFV